MNLFISVINHNHDEMICDNSTLKNLATEHSVILKSNTNATKKLKEYCQNSGIILLQGNKKKGFGANNNEVFAYAKQQLNASKKDLFLVMNPDVTIEKNTVNALITSAINDNSGISTINLYLNKEMTIYDSSIRLFPLLLNPVKTLLGMKRTDHYDKSKINNPIHIDWAAGSFLLFTFSVYEQLHGFDEKYFMYFEDADICRRAYKKGIRVIYYPNYRAVHEAQLTNRKIISKSFIYYLSSNIRYFLTYK